MEKHYILERLQELYKSTSTQGEVRGSFELLLEVLIDIRDEIKKYNDTSPNLR